MNEDDPNIGFGIRNNIEINHKRKVLEIGNSLTIIKKS